MHLGQDDLSPRDARRIMGPAALIGVSTHDRSQLEAAILAGAGYLGVGPVFPSATKEFSEPELAGLGYVRLAAETTSLPWFAIGGITEENIDRVLEAGARAGRRQWRRGAIEAAPGASSLRLKARLGGVEPPDEADDPIMNRALASRKPKRFPCRRRWSGRCHRWCELPRRNAASNWLHGRYTPRASISQKNRAKRRVSLLERVS